MKPVGSKGVSHNTDIFESTVPEAPQAPKGHSEVDKFSNDPDVQAHVHMVAELTARCVHMSTRRAQLQTRITGLYQKLERLQAEIQAAEKESATLAESIDLVTDQMNKHGRDAGNIINSMESFPK